MSFFKSNDINKTLLIYYNGGLGDTFMYTRFIPKLCQLHSNNKIIFSVQNNLFWLYSLLFKNIQNLSVSTLQNNLKFDYHCSIEKMLYYLDFTKSEDIYFEPYINIIMNTHTHKMVTNETILDIITKLNESNKKSYVLNWHGNYKNTHEKFNRGMDLHTLIPILNNSNNWIIVTKDITNKEMKILKQFNTIILKEYPDFDTIPFSDTMTIFKHVDGVISTDTSLVHLAASMGVPTTVLLTIGYEWRWSNIHWYPNIKRIIQEKATCWDNVIKTLKETL